MKNIYQDKYWINKTKKMLNTDDVTEEDVKNCKNEYYRKYRQDNPDKVQNSINNYYIKKAKTLLDNNN